MKRKIGPLPVWAWGVAIIAGVVGLYLYRQHQASSAVGGGPGDLPDLGAGAAGKAGVKSVPGAAIGRRPGFSQLPAHLPHPPPPHRQPTPTPPAPVPPHKKAAQHEEAETPIDSGPMHPLIPHPVPAKRLPIHA